MLFYLFFILFFLKIFIILMLLLQVQENKRSKKTACTESNASYRRRSGPPTRQCKSRHGGRWDCILQYKRDASTWKVQEMWHFMYMQQIKFLVCSRPRRFMAERASHSSSFLPSSYISGINSIIPHFQDIIHHSLT